MLFLKDNSRAFFLFFFVSLPFFSLFSPSFADADSPPPNEFQITASNFSSPPPAPPLPGHTHVSTPFKPSTAVLVAVLTTLFSLTLLLLLYVKYVQHNGFNSTIHARGLGSSGGRKNSGLHRTVIQSLPIFRFNSLRGQKNGLECAVCITRFESSEVLRLLPKCKHAFHVECVDTWLDAHSTCPLCRHRVDPEDIVLIDHNSASGHILHDNHQSPPGDAAVSDLESGNVESEVKIDIETTEADTHRRSASLSQIVLTGGSERQPSRSRNHLGPASFARRSSDSSGLRKMNNESFTVGCFDRYPWHQRRKDGLLLTNGEDTDADKTRFEHRIVLSRSGSQSRWSDVQQSDLLYLQSEVILSESIPSVGRAQSQRTGSVGGGRNNGKSVINTRSV